MASLAVMGLMVISATGIMAGKQKQGYYHQAGFTLLEILIVIVIIAIVLSFSILSIDTEPEKLDNETDRLTALMEMVAEEAVMNSREYRLLIEEQGYSFQVFQGGKWQNSDDEIFRRRQLPEGFYLSAEIENQSMPIASSAEEKGEPIASILFLSSDEATPFELSITGPSGSQRSISNLDGPITVLPLPP
jgi:general secretion pathway protein H